MPEETNKGPALTSSLSQVIALQLVILVLSSVIQERLCLPHVGHSLFQSAPADPLQGPAEPGSHSGGDLGKVYLEKGKILLAEKGEESCERNSPEDSKVHGKGEKGGVTGAGPQGLSNSWRRPQMMQIAPMKPMKVHSRPDIYGRCHAGAGGCTLEGRCNLWRPTTGSGSWWDLWPVGKRPHRETFSGKNGEPVRVPHFSKGKLCGERSSRGELLWTDNKSYSPALCTAEGGGILGIRNGK